MGNSDLRIDPSRPATCYIHHLLADSDDPACRGRYIRLIIHPNEDDLRAAGTAYNKRRGSDQDLRGSAGLFQPTRFRSRYDRKAKAWVDTTTAFAGIMRLADGYLNSQVIAHESTHAALHVTRLHDWAKPGSDGNADFGDGCDAREEAFAYLLGGIAHEVNNAVLQYQAALPHNPPAPEGDSCLCKMTCTPPRPTSTPSTPTARARPPRYATQ